jgi:L-ascorbate metabolism protein UlaG (beta-lactamase superfamily)
MMMKLILFLFLVGSAFAQDYPKSDHYDGERFFNIEKTKDRSFIEFLQWMFNGEAADWPKQVANKNFPTPKLDARDRGIFTFVNHATYLIQLKGLNVLTDPVFSERVSPVPFLGPKRVRRPGIEFENLPGIQVVMISHNHYDHMDKISLQRLEDKFHPLFLVPLGEKDRLKGWGLSNVKELDWWQEHKVQEVSFNFTRVQHWSNRFPWDKRKTLWGGYYIKTPSASIYFGGDSGYGNHYTETKLKLGSPDVAILPIGAYEPRWFMREMHMNPEEAIQAHLDLGSKVSLPMHFGTFQLTDEGIDEPVRSLEAARAEKSLTSEDFPILDQGQSYRLY